jgi:hypothetical protein
MRFVGLFLFLAALAGLYTLLGWLGTQELGFVPPDKIDFGGYFKEMGRHFPIDVFGLLAAAFLVLLGLKWLVLGRSKGPTPPPPPEDPSDDKAARRYELQMATFRPSPRMPTALILNSYLVLSMVVGLYFGRDCGDSFLLGVMTATLCLALLFGLVMVILAKFEKSLATPGSLVGFLVHVLGLGIVVTGAVLRMV